MTLIPLLIASNLAGINAAVDVLIPKDVVISLAILPPLLDLDLVIVVSHLLAALVRRVSAFAPLAAFRTVGAPVVIPSGVACSQE